MIITNGSILTMNKDLQIIEGGALRIDSGVITHMGRETVIREMFPHEPVTDAEGMLIMPGMICGHTHFYGAFARGLAIPGKAPAHFVDILEKLWWRLDKALDPDAVRLSALVCLIDAIRHGTTTLVDHHASPACIDGSLDIIADTVLNAGLRACLCYEVTDRNGPAESRAGIAENIRFIKRCKSEKNPFLAATFGLHASLTLSPQTLDRCHADASTLDSGFHIHAAEGISDQIDSVKKYQMRVINRLAKHRITGAKSVLVHCVQVSDDEIDILADTGSRVTHQPRSNMNNAVGTAPVPRMLEKGIPVCLGNDGFSNNMWAEWKAAYLVHKLAAQDPRQAQGYDIVRMGVANNADLMKVFWPGQTIGILEPGASADVLLVDYKPFTPLTAGNLPWHMLFGFESGMIHSTMVRGEWLMKNFKLTKIDEKQICLEAQKASKNVWQRFEEGFLAK